jgi:hypothetical protein
MTQSRQAQMSDHHGKVAAIHRLGRELGTLAIGAHGTGVRGLIQVMGIRMRRPVLTRIETEQQSLGPRVIVMVGRMVRLRECEAKEIQQAEPEAGVTEDVPGVKQLGFHAEAGGKTTANGDSNVLM